MNLFKVSNLCDGVRGGTFLSFCAKADDATIERITDLKMGFRMNEIGVLEMITVIWGGNLDLF